MKSGNLLSLLPSRRPCPSVQQFLPVGTERNAGEVERVKKRVTCQLPSIRGFEDLILFNSLNKTQKRPCPAALPAPSPFIFLIILQVRIGLCSPRPIGRRRYKITAYLHEEQSVDNSTINSSDCLNHIDHSSSWVSTR